ncbi:DNA helicase [Pseudomonas phage PMBT14]|uniref:DNA helicase n=1 Tax=Pseudomonas phage PMBT14 TaxID=2059855 RepID=A0A2I6PI60_9CAUD|nr:head scaffolding protein [Pseudomonas phage PMBT14]AUM59722.1 DNA helicase [Pseudomonas phage PMBT14]
MALQLILQTLDGLSADVAKEYTEQEDGSFRLDVTGLEDTGALKRAKEHEKNQRKQAQTRVTELQSKIEDLEDQIAALGDPNKNSADALKLQKLERQLTDAQGKLTARETELMGEISRLTSTASATVLVNDLTDFPDLMLPMVSARLTTVLENGKAVVKVLDPDGDVGSMTVDELKAEIENDTKYAPLLRGSQGSGSGAPGKGKGPTNGKTKLSDYTGPERVELQQKNPALFQQLLAESKNPKIR